MTPKEKAINFATEQIEQLCPSLMEMPIEVLEDFFWPNSHLTKEIGYTLGIIQGYMEALDIPGASLGEKIDAIIDIMHDAFDKA